jgi:hypothetical protein
MSEHDREALSDILGVLDRALGFPITNLQTLEKTDYLQDALVRCLEVIGEATKRLSQDFRDLHPEVPWRAMAAGRCLRPKPITPLPQLRSMPWHRLSGVWARRWSVWGGRGSHP